MFTNCSVLYTYLHTRNIRHEFILNEIRPADQVSDLNILSELSSAEKKRGRKDRIASSAVVALPLMALGTQACLT